MPRRSRAEDDLAPYMPPSRSAVLQPPDSLSPGARDVWLDLVGSLPPDHFERSDLTLVEAYVEAAALARQMVPRLATDRNALSTWEKAVKAQSILALRLRISPQARRATAKVARPLSWSDNFALSRADGR
jgi:phage terminase small subunit